MGFREWQSNHPRTTLSLVTACVAIASCGIVAEVHGNRRAIRTTVPDQYFSIDDGKTFFQAAGTNIAPFDYNGATADRAYVFEANHQRFVGYLERYKPAARTQVLAGKNSIDISVNGRELKKPGDSNWVSASNYAAVGRIMNVVSPFGSGDVVAPVEP